jgi:hypothetical protein
MLPKPQPVRPMDQYAAFEELMAAAAWTHGQPRRLR